MIQNFEIGDKVRQEGNNDIHTIKEIRASKLPLGWFATVVFEDGGFGMVDSSGFTDMTKI